uniref:RNA polymerase II subunit A C-terminal domain phosphatase n=1 Tax=Panagrolaimus sp. ES5 TaxID=591445 RepID=A0AC34FV86_9BILA
MIHHVPELVVSKNLADKLGAKEYEQVLKNRKLILLVDLDQTLIHTTNRLSKKYEARNDLFRFQCQDGLYYTKLRPHTREFLENMNRLYEMHIISFGQRYYAHQIAKFLDPDGKLFSQRIMSRDELTSVRHKTNNIPALFPCPDQRKLIVIIDDRDDVWEYSESLVRIRPYKFFSDVDDINAPPTAPRGSVKKLEVEEAAKGKEPDEGSKAEVEKREVTPPPLTPSPTIPEDSDDVLEDVERVLTEVHRAFFEHYDKTKEVTDICAIVSYMRKQVLKNEIICLSGIVPIGYPKKRSLVYRLCEQFGATVADEIDENTTVLIAARPSTEYANTFSKYLSALQ